MRALFFCSITLPITLLLLQSSSCVPDDGSPDLLPKAPDHMLRNFLASEDSEPGAQSFNCITSFNPLPLSTLQLLPSPLSLLPFLTRGSGDEEREFFLTEGGFLVSNGALSSRPLNLCAIHWR